MKNSKIRILLTFAGFIAMQKTQADWWVDVTETVRSKSDQGFKVDPNTINNGSDPAYGLIKKLEITGSVRIGENKIVSGFNADAIDTAFYGKDNEIDVTDKVKKLLSDNKYFFVKNSILIPNMLDPAPNQVKRLRIEFKDGKEVYIDGKNVPAATRAIASARYGVDNRPQKEVGERCDYDPDCKSGHCRNALVGYGFGSNATVKKCFYN